MFVGDIAINFRSVYKDYKTDELVTNSKKIALRYVLNGRFWVDLIASMPLEFIALLMPSGGSIDVRFLGMLKLVRLLRLGRMITFLKANQKLKISMKISQILFFLLLTIHWINWLWYLTIDSNKTWFPPKDLDSKETIAYDGTRFQRYVLFEYYAILIMMGSESLPTTQTELIIATILALVWTLFMGMVIGEVASLLDAITKDGRK